MEKYYFEEEWKEAVLLTKENKSTVLVLDGEELEICCPETVRGNVSECGTPCLVLESKYSKNGNYEAMAFSLDNPYRENKDWICMNPIIIEDAVGYFLANHHMEEMVSGSMVSRKIESREEDGAGPDFILGDAWIELNVPDAILNAAGDGWLQVKSLMLTDEKAVRYMDMVSGMEDGNKRFILLTVFQHGLNGRMGDFLCRGLSRLFGVDMLETTEFWVADLKLEPDGITLLSFQNITDKVLLS